MKLLAAVAAACLVPQALAAECAATSPATTTALVELYTSEGCNSCPPADRWLSSLGTRGYAPSRVVPLELHVDYWDYIGWKDPYAQARFSGRQRELAGIGHSAFVYTPQVLLQGRDFRRWGSGDFDAALKRINARPARARLALKLDPGAKDAFEVEVRAEVLDAAQRGDAALYLGAYESGLQSAVRAGENEGRTLRHDFVVLRWLGPIEFRGHQALAEHRRIALPRGALPANSGVVAFVQNRANAEVLQALMLPACGG
jgi:hypothetical protein